MGILTIWGGRQKDATGVGLWHCPWAPARGRGGRWRSLAYYVTHYVLDRPVDWYAADIAKLGPGTENDLIRYGKDLIVNTPRHVGKNATDPAMRYAGNDLACQNCHLNAGLQPFVSTFKRPFP
jgi:hypothetical protein